MKDADLPPPPKKFVNLINLQHDKDQCNSFRREARSRGERGGTRTSKMTVTLCEGEGKFYMTCTRCGDAWEIDGIDNFSVENILDAKKFKKEKHK